MPALAQVRVRFQVRVRVRVRIRVRVKVGVRVRVRVRRALGSACSATLDRLSWHGTMTWLAWINKDGGQANSDLADLTNRQLLIDITDHPPKYRAGKRLHFRHCNKKNIRCNFRDYSAVWDLEIE